MSAPARVIATASAAICDRCATTLADDGRVPNIATLRLRGARILVDKVAPVGQSREHRVSEHLFAPAQHGRIRATYGIEARVLAIGPDIDPADMQPGDRVIIDEFGGRPLWWGDCALPYWVVGDGEVMVVLQREPDDAPEEVNDGSHS